MERKKKHGNKNKTLTFTPYANFQNNSVLQSFFLTKFILLLSNFNLQCLCMCFINAKIYNATIN